MIFDVIVIVLLIVPMAAGMAKGFIHMSLQTLGWIGGLIIAFFVTKPLSAAAEDGFLGVMIADNLEEKFAGSTQALNDTAEGLPGIVSGGLSLGGEKVSELFVGLMTSLLVAVIVFVAIVIVVRVVIKLLVRPVAKRHGGIINGADRILGTAVGFVEGIILVFVFMALLVPFVGIGDAETARTVVNGLDSSFIAGTLYDNNLLLVVTGGFFS